MESFFHTLNIELVHQRRWKTREKARRDLFAYIRDTLTDAGSTLLSYTELPNRPNYRWSKPVSAKAR